MGLNNKDIDKIKLPDNLDERLKKIVDKAYKKKITKNNKRRITIAALLAFMIIGGVFSVNSQYVGANVMRVKEVYQNSYEVSKDSIGYKNGIIERELNLYGIKVKVKAWVEDGYIYWDVIKDYSEFNIEDWKSKNKDKIDKWKKENNIKDDSKIVYYPIPNVSTHILINSEEPKSSSGYLSEVSDDNKVYKFKSSALIDDKFLEEDNFNIEIKLNDIIMGEKYRKKIEGTEGYEVSEGEPLQQESTESIKFNLKAKDEKQIIKSAELNYTFDLNGAGQTTLIEAKIHPGYIELFYFNSDIKFENHRFQFFDIELEDGTKIDEISEIGRDDLYAPEGWDGKDWSVVPWRAQYKGKVTGDTLKITPRVISHNKGEEYNYSKSDSIIIKLN
ncbi:hypothetical protein [Clostridium mediterraneense]|uniref:hypothetical protein n=1 Tax=Clostridium mediterraneense TaxID=1805472 RepID=UPI00082FEBD8|nr:hypothetical protein [Clostridium mediterraneense]